MNTGIPRLVEGVLSLIGLAALAPLLAIVALAVKLSSPGPILFRQQRVGRLGRPFILLKFRSMRSGASGDQVTASGDGRVTATGRVLRKLKIDELPELWNVVRGDLSLVGPRPEVPRFVDLTSPVWQRILESRPGITDPVTLRLRNEEELIANAGADPEAFYREVLLPFKLKGYAAYLDERSWLSDVAVLWATVLAVVMPSRAPIPSIEELCAEANARTEGRPIV